jgi:tetratricopeptide (TPR) repeat protein
MMKRVRITTLVPTAVILTLVALAPAALQAGSYGTELPFVAGTGARPSALGLAATSLTGEPSLQYYNPASLAKLQYKTFEFYRTTFFDSKSVYHTAQYAHPMLNYGTLAVSVLRLDVGEIEERDIYNNLLSTDLKNAQTRVLLGYAHSLHSALAAGVNLKIDNQSFAGYSGSGVGMDLGFLATKAFAEESFFEYVRGGLSIQNLIEPSVKLDQDDVADPLSVAFGASAVASAGRIGFVTAIDVVAPRFSPYQFRFGQEVGYADILAVRFGFDGSTPTFGAGAEWRNVAVDYAFRSEDLGSNHRISVVIRFGSSVDERLEAGRMALEAELDRQINSKMTELESSQLSETMRRADDLFAQGKYPQAAGQYELALLWDADNDLARSRIETCRYYGEMAQAQSSMKEENFLEALYYLRQALSRSPDDPEVTALITECNRQIRRQTDHTEMIDRMLKRSIDLYATRRFVEAQAGFREVLNLNPDNKLAAEYEQKSYANIQNLKHRLVVEANNLADRGDYAAAVNALEQAQHYDPSDESLVARIHELDAKQREAERRQAARDRATATPRVRPPVASPKSPAVDRSLLEPKYNEGLRSFEKGDFDAAVRRFHEVWAVAPDFHNVQELLTKAYLFMGMKKYSEEKYGEAIVIWERALTVAPDNSKAKRYLQKAKEEASRLGRVNDE